MVRKYWVVRYFFRGGNKTPYEVAAKTREAARKSNKMLRESDTFKVDGIYKVIEHEYAPQTGVISKVLKRSS